ncbi:MAG: LysM peptidoglycan-binding domain-containing protein [Caldilineaceae bacterium]
MKFPSAIHRLYRSPQCWRLSLFAALLLGTILFCAGSVVSLSLITLSATTVHAQADEEPADQAENGYTYTVQRGDNWYSVATRTGLTIAELRAANPQAVRSSGWLITGEKLFIPASQPVATTTYTVQPGESWSVIAKKFGISIQLLKAANPRSIRYGDVLRRNEVLVIPLPTDAVTPEGAADAAAEQVTPAVSGTPAITETIAAETVTTTVVTTETVTTTVETEEATPEATPTPEATATATEEPTATATATTAPTATEEPTATATVESTPTESSAAAPAEDVTAAEAQCPSVFADYPVAMLMVLNDAGGIEALQSFLTACNAASAAPVALQDLTGDGLDDLVLIYQNPDPALVQPVMELLILQGSADGFAIGYQARAESEVNLLGTIDVNGDTQPDVAWIETTCGAETCFDTVQVYSWNGSAWQDWTATKITMANAEIRLEDQSEAGQGLEVVLSGGEYVDAAAGPQRSRTELWGSLDGAPYTLLDKSYAASDCLYFAVLDANTAFLTGGEDNFEQAEALYTKAATDSSLTACGQRENELAELQSFSLYRLALIAAYRGQPEVAADLIGSITSAYPAGSYDSVGQVWLDAYQTEYDIEAACVAVTTYAESTPEATAVLADYGYANPSFRAAEICPVLDVTVPTPPAASNAEATDASADTAEANNEAAVSATAAITASATVTNTEAAPALATCPDSLAGYVDMLPTVLTTAQAKVQVITEWLRSCNAIDEQRGAVELTDLNQDSRQDALFLPTIVSDRGFGPDGAQGAVLIYHGTADGEYTLVANPEIYGLPTLLTVADLNGDQQTDIAWSVEGCATSCVSEVQIVTWDGAAYIPLIEPGAIIAEGTASFTEVPAGDPGVGKQLVLVGGVSNTEEGGLAVPHTEVWQSIDGQPFQRIRWTYDRTVEGADCLALRLVEADVALQAAHVLGYAAALDLYTKSIDPTLQACSLLGMAAAEELQLLQGLASFRLIQTHALRGDFVAAGEILTSLSQGQPESGYTQAAQQWLDAYESNGDAAAACAAVQPIFDENANLWQITDHYGYNHPALAAEQICYVP